MAGQVLCGLCFAYNSTYFFQQVGLTAQQTYQLNLGGTGMALVATILCWVFIMPNVGNRAAYVWGMLGMAIILIIIGILNTHTSNDQVAMAQAVLTLVWTFVFQLSAGQFGWALPAELGSTRLRQKTVCLARNSYAITAVVAGTLQPYFMNPPSGTSRATPGSSGAAPPWSPLSGPTSDSRDEEPHLRGLDLLFAKKVSARKFSTYNLDVFDQDQNEQVAAEYFRAR